MIEINSRKDLFPFWFFPSQVTLENLFGRRSVSKWGFLEVLKNNVVILTDAVEFTKDIDMERTKKALERAKQRLRSKEKEIDIPRALAALKRAQNRIAVCEECVKERTI